MRGKAKAIKTGMTIIEAENLDDHELQQKVDPQ